jgi:hypothetical protein
MFLVYSCGQKTQEVCGDEGEIKKNSYFGFVLGGFLGGTFYGVVAEGKMSGVINIYFCSGGAPFSKIWVNAEIQQHCHSGQVIASRNPGGDLTWMPTPPSLKLWRTGRRPA